MSARTAVASSPTPNPSLTNQKADLATSVKTTAAVAAAASSRPSVLTRQTTQEEDEDEEEEDEEEEEEDEEDVEEEEEEGSEEEEESEDEEEEAESEDEDRKNILSKRTTASASKSSAAATPATNNYQSLSSPAASSSWRSHVASKGTASLASFPRHDSDPKPVTKSTTRDLAERGLYRSRTLGDEQVTDNDDDDSDVTALLTRAARVRREFASGSSNSSLNSDPTLILGPSPTKEPYAVKFSTGPRSDYAKLKASRQDSDSVISSTQRSHAGEDQSKFVPTSSSLTPSPSSASKQIFDPAPPSLIRDPSPTNHQIRHRLQEVDEESSDTYFDASPTSAVMTSRKSSSRNTTSFAPSVRKTAGNRNDRDDCSPSKSSTSSSTKSKQSRKPANKSHSQLSSSTNPSAGSLGTAAARNRNRQFFSRGWLSAVNSFSPSNVASSLVRCTQSLIPGFLYKASSPAHPCDK